MHLLLTLLLLLPGLIRAEVSSAFLYISPSDQALTFRLAHSIPFCSPVIHVSAPAGEDLPKSRFAVRFDGAGQPHPESGCGINQITDRGLEHLKQLGQDLFKENDGVYANLRQSKISLHASEGQQFFGTLEAVYASSFKETGHATIHGAAADVDPYGISAKRCSGITDAWARLFKCDAYKEIRSRLDNFCDSLHLTCPQDSATAPLAFSLLLASREEGAELSPEQKKTVTTAAIDTTRLILKDEALTQLLLASALRRLRNQVTAALLDAPKGSGAGITQIHSHMYLVQAVLFSYLTDTPAVPERYWALEIARDGTTTITADGDTTQATHLTSTELLARIDHLVA